ncbi:hypothetical protein LPJ72_004405 [Coemansia sp. Benny D160-2]|nr:hypothetical protein LPJ72_004405 [Coemansia sp. Benny D160-2]
MQTSGKVAIVTGGARGIGKRIVEVLVEKGAKVVIGDVLEQGEQVAEELNDKMGDKVAVFHTCNVRNLDEIAELQNRAITEFGAMDIVVNNAGIGGSYLWADENSESISKTIDINLKAPIEGTRLAVKSFYKAGRPGCVINISSILGIRYSELTAVYGATKAAIIAFTASAAPLAQGTPPVRVNSVAPVHIETNTTSNEIPESIDKHLRSFGVNTVDGVASEVIRCIEDETLAGDTVVMNSNADGSVREGPKAESCGFIEYIKA